MYEDVLDLEEALDRSEEENKMLREMNDVLRKKNESLKRTEADGASACTSGVPQDKP